MDIPLGANTARISQIHVCSNLGERRCMSQQYTFRTLSLATSKSWWSVERGVSKGSLIFVQIAWQWRKPERDITYGSSELCQQVACPSFKSQLQPDSHPSLTILSSLSHYASTGQTMLKVYLLVTCVCVLIASVLYIFYFNRLLAAAIGLFLRIRYWNKGGSSIWIQIGQYSALE